MKKGRDGSAPPRQSLIVNNNYSNSFGISGFPAFLARRREKINPSNSRQTIAVKTKLIGYSSLPFVTDMPGCLFP
jgi:hypothetical protein